MPSATFTSISSWIARNFEGFVAGLLTAFGIATLMAVLVMAREAVGRGVGGATAWVKRAILGVLRWLVAALESSSSEVVTVDKLGEAVDGGDAKVEEKETAAGTSAGVVSGRDDREKSGEEEERKAESVGKAVALERREKKPFEFRKRLWNEPPEGYEFAEGYGFEEENTPYDYTSYECLDALQKEFKDIGGKDFEWRTNWLDLETQMGLTGDYWRWARGKSGSTESSEKEKAFYKGLMENLNIDRQEIRGERKENNKQHGKTWEDEDEMWRLMYKTSERELQKSAGNSS